MKFMQINILLYVGIIILILNALLRSWQQLAAHWLRTTARRHRQGLISGHTVL
jgi:hypothetical protein